ncbi:MAG: tetratricopeptide repeat protein [Saprospiraceae bacterium]
MDNTERIERYLNGAMDANEREQFESELQRDAALREELALQRDMMTWVAQQARREHLRETLARLGQPYFAERRSRTLVRRLIIPALSAAAALALILLWPTLFADRLYDRFAEFPALALTEKSNAAPDVSAIESDFNRGDYAAAYEGLQAYRQRKPDDPQAQLYAGICLMELGKTREARSLFEGLLKTPDFGDYAQWYIALSFLKDKDRKACALALDRIAPSSPFYEKARALAQKL